MVVALINTNMVTLTLVIIRMAVGRVRAHIPVETGLGPRRDFGRIIYS